MNISPLRCFGAGRSKKTKAETKVQEGASAVSPKKKTVSPVLPGFGSDFGRNLDGNAQNSNQEPKLTVNTALNSNPTNPTTGPIMSTITSIRQTSGPLAVDSPMASENNLAPQPWNRTNSHTTPQSKTSQYIEKITSENEKLKRELNAEKLAREDEAQRVSAARSKAEDSRAEHQHLQVVVDANARTLERKERKVEELKAQLEAEAKRRKVAEERAEEALKMLGDTRSKTQQLIAAAHEQKHLAEANLDGAREGYKRITDGQEKRLAKLTEEVNQLRRQRYDDADKIERHAIVTEQLQHELTRHQRTEGKMVDALGQYKEEHRKELDRLIEEAGGLRAIIPKNEAAAAALLGDLQTTLDKMKWVMAQSSRQSGA